MKLVRAYGGCLGARSRRRTWMAAKSLGELSSSVRAGDIRMGKPAWGNAQALQSEYIGLTEGTRGTETSKYPEEKRKIS